MTTSTKIAAPYQTDSFGTSGTAKFTWTPTRGTNWTADSAATTTVDFVDKVSFFLWGSAADKTGEDPYKTMNTWYTTNKAALDSASLASSAQVGPWGLYVDIQRNIADTNVRAPPAFSVKAALEATTSCYANTSISTGGGDANLLYAPPVGTIGASFGFGIKNSTTGALSPWLVWGSRVLTLATTSAAGTASVIWDSYDWTPNTTITDFAAISASQQTTLSGTTSASGTAYTVFNSANDGVFPPRTTARTCDTTKWASATACEGVTKWALSTGTDYTSSTAKGTKRAWIWLADANPTAKASVFGVEKSDVLQIQLHQENTWFGTGTGTAGVCALPASGAATTYNNRRNLWGVGTWTHSGASATLLGASAVMAALISFF